MRDKSKKPETRDVYAVCDPERGACKIGVSNDARARIRNLQTGSPVDYRLAHVERVPYRMGTAVEREARRALTDAGHLKVREWIKNCTPDQARGAIIDAHARVRGRNSTF